MSKIRIVTDTKTGKPRGYAFIEFEREKDMKGAVSCAFGGLAAGSGSTRLTR